MKPASSTPTALLLIDIQRGFDHPSHWGSKRNTPDFETNVAALLQAFRAASSHIIHVHHHSSQPGSALHPSATFTPPGSDSGLPVLAVDPQPYAKPLPSEPIFVKSVNSSFIGTGLEAHLRENGIGQLVIVGLTTDHCVSTTTRMAANLKVLGDEGGVDGSGPGANDHGVLLVSDATATFGKGDFDADLLHKAHLASLDGEFCRVVNTKDVLNRVLGL